MNQPTEDDVSIEEEPPIILAVIFILLFLYPLITYIYRLSNKKAIGELERHAAEDAFRAEILAYLDAISPGPPPRIMAYLTPPPSRYKYHDCATCHAPTNNHCSRCRTVMYCSYECQIKDWREGHRDACMQQLNLATGAFEHMPFLSKASPLLAERKSMSKSSQILRKSEHGSSAVSSEKNDYSIREETQPSKLLIKQVPSNDYGSWDTENGYCEALQRSFSMEHEALEDLLRDETAKPIMLSYAVLKDITHNFSQFIGGGGSGEGFLRNGNVAVKKLYNMEVFTDKQFADELKCLIRVKHNNIVRLLGYCSDTQQKLVQHDGQYVLADIRQRFLCIEYARNKSLDDYLKDKSHAHKWDTRYQLIEGICQGLHYLHKKESITHLDLKPGNVLLDHNMVPKITDFGISRRFTGTQSRIITKSLCGSLGYIAPELLDKGEISFKSDIFSLGIIIRNILSGSTELSDSENWHQSLGIDCPQFKRFIKIAQLCIENDPNKRPTIDCIIDMLKDKGSEESPV